MIGRLRFVFIRMGYGAAVAIVKWSMGSIAPLCAVMEEGRGFNLFMSKIGPPHYSSVTLIS